MRRLIVAAASTLLLASGAFAGTLETQYAQLSGITGNVLVDQGKGFAPVTAATQLHPGDRIMVSGKGGALLTYGPGCSVTLAPDSLTTFTGTESCVLGTQGTGGNGSGVLLMGMGGAGIVAGASAGSAFSNDSKTEPQS